MGAHPLAVVVFLGLPMMVMVHLGLSNAEAFGGGGADSRRERKSQGRAGNERKKRLHFSLSTGFVDEIIQPESEAV